MASGSGLSKHTHQRQGVEIVGLTKIRGMTFIYNHSNMTQVYCTYLPSLIYLCYILLQVY